MGNWLQIRGNIEKWFVGIKLEALDGAARDMYNRAGVVMSNGVNGKIFNAMDLVPPDSFVNINIKDPSDNSREGLAYDFRTVGQNEYQWELNLSTSYSSASVMLSLENLANIPKNVQLTLKDMATGEIIKIDGDRSLTLTLHKGSSNKYLLIARMGVDPTIIKDETHPLYFGLTGVNPNPFNPSTTICFGVEKSGNVKLSIYNINGQLVTTLMEGSVGFRTAQYCVECEGSFFRSVFGGIRGEREAGFTESEPGEINE